MGWTYSIPFILDLGEVHAAATSGFVEEEGTVRGDDFYHVGDGLVVAVRGRAQAFFRPGLMGKDSAVIVAVAIVAPFNGIVLMRPYYVL